MRSLALAVLFSFPFSLADAQTGPEQYTYAVVISSAAYANPGWKAVADTLLKKHSTTSSRLFTWNTSVTDIKNDLSAFMPTYIGFIARPATECNTAFVAAASQLSRTLDSDPYGDAYWGVITGFEASDALRAVTESLLVKTVILASSDIAYEPPLQRYYQALGMPCDSYTKTDYLFENTGGKVYSVEQRPENQQDRVHLVSKWLNASTLNIPVSGQGTISGTFDCLITGGHGNINVWQMHYNDAGTEGFLRSSNGQLTGAPYSGNSIAINAQTPKIFWHVSNCLMGKPDNINNWVYAAFHTGHAVQLFGFIPTASTGDEFMAWGLFDRVTKFAGKYTLPQGFFICNNNAQFELRHSTGLFNQSGVNSYINATVVYGDPAADVRFYGFGDSMRSYKESFSYTTNAQGISTFDYSITTMAHELQFDQYYCYQFRPVFFMPVRIDPNTVTITQNDGNTAEITDNLILWELLRSGQTMQKGSTKTLRWTARIISQTEVISGAVATSRPHKRMITSFNPCNRTLTINFSTIPVEPFSITVVSASGKTVCCKTMVSGEQRYTFKSDLGSGVYVALIKNSTSVLRDKIAVAR